MKIDAGLGGRCDGTTPEGRVEGTITAPEGPGRLTGPWPIAREGRSVATSVVYARNPKGSKNFIHLLHRARRSVPGDWNALSRRTPDSLRTLREGGPPLET